MLIQLCLLLLSVGAWASHEGSSPKSTTEDELFSELDFVFPENFLSKFPEESEFFSVKILGYLFFNIFAKYLGEHEPMKFWSKFNRNDFNRVAIDAAFYEYLTKFADRKMKHRTFNPLKSSTSSSEDIAIDRIGDYLDNLSAAEIPADQSETQSQATKTKDCMQHIAEVFEGSPLGIPGIDFPNYQDIPKTSFSCANKLVPGIYADTETGCQVFHTCWPHRIDSFLCPMGTTFNQALLTCDIWHESDCSPPLFDRSPFAKGTIPRNVEPSVALDDATLTTSESPSFTPEWNIPEFDGTCQSLINDPLRLHMKFNPAKCRVTDLESGTTVKVEWITPKSDSKVVEVTTEHPLKEDHVDTTSEEQVDPSTTELPSDNQDKIPQWMNYGFIEKSVFKETSQGKMKHFHSVRKSTLLKPSKPSEETIKQVFESMIKTLDLGTKILNEGLLPLVEKIVLDSRRKKSKS